LLLTAVVKAAMHLLSGVQWWMKKRMVEVSALILLTGCAIYPDDSVLEKKCNWLTQVQLGKRLLKQR